MVERRFGNMRERECGNGAILCRDKELRVRTVSQGGIMSKLPCKLDMVLKWSSGVHITNSGENRRNLVSSHP